jgi:hypothetical protein
LDPFDGWHVVRTRIIQVIDPFDKILHVNRLPFDNICSRAVLETQKYGFQRIAAKMGLKRIGGLATVT